MHVECERVHPIDRSFKSMHHVVQQRVAAIGRRVRRLLVLYGLSWFVGILVGSAVVWMAIDTLLRFSDHGVRLIGSVAVAGCSLWAAWRYLLPALRQPLDDVVVAQRIECHFAGMGDQLSSSVEFLRQEANDPLAGSPALREAAIAQLEETALSLDWRRALNSRPAVQAACCAALVSLVAVALACGFPADARLAFVRLIKPLGGDAWPPVNDLAFTMRVERIARDQPFEVELIDRNHRLPDDVRIQYRAAGENGSLQVDAQRMQRIGDSMVARRDRVLAPFDYRAEGGDDRKMPWIHVDVVEPPQFDTVQIRLHPPAYTAWPAQPSPRRIVALRGTTVELAAHSTKPLRSAVLHLPGGSEVTLQHSADGLQWSISASDGPPAKSTASVTSIPVTSILADSPTVWTIDKSGPYWFELRDGEGLVGGLSDRWDIQAVVDQPPTVAIEAPLGNLAVTPTATVPVKVLAKDDLALQSVALVYSRSDHTELGEVAISLFDGPKQSPGSTPIGPAGLPPGVSRGSDYAWELAPLGLPPGTALLMTAVATDYVPQKGISSPRRLTIITPAELDDRLAQRQSLVYSELGRILKLQQSARLQTAALETQLEQAGRFQKQDIDQLRGADVSQRQIHSSLTGRTDGVRSMVVGLLDELSINHVENPAMRRRMQGLADELGRLDAGELSAAERDLTAVVKGAQDPASSGAKNRPAPAVAQALNNAGRDQDAVSMSLERMLGDLAEWNSFRGLARELGQIRRDLNEIEQTTKALGARTVTQDLHDLSPQQQADVKKLSQRQLDQARQFDKLQQRLDQVSQELRQSDPLASASLADALHLARRKVPGSILHDAGEKIADNQIGNALDEQAAAGGVLDEMLDTLSNRPEQDLSRLVAKLREAESKLSAVRKDEDGLRKRLHDAANSAKDNSAANQAELKTELDRLARRQQEVQEDTQHLAHELQRLQADRAAAAAARAAGHMHRAAHGAEQGANGGASGSPTENNAAEADAAEHDLAEAQHQLAAVRRQAESDLAREQLQRLDDSLQSLVDRQQHTITETTRLEKLRVEQAGLSRGQAATVLELGNEQKTLAGDTGDLAAKLAGAEAFQFLLTSAAREMTRTAERLAARDTGAATQQLEQDVLARLNQLMTASKGNKPGSAAANSTAGGPGGNGQGAGQRRSLAEIRLVQLMQEDLNRRTRRLNDAIGKAGHPNDEGRQEFVELTHEQQRLAELIQNMIGQPDDTPTPDSAPKPFPDDNHKQP
jgi:hypothetical protein